MDLRLRMVPLPIYRLRGVVTWVFPLRLVVLLLDSRGDGTGGGGALLRIEGGGGARRLAEVPEGAIQERRLADVAGAEGARRRGELHDELRRLLLQPPERRRADKRRTASQVSAASL